jgi:hypothetical protein
VESDPVKSLAEKIARVIQTESRGDDISSIVAALEKIDGRLEKLEQLSSNPQAAVVSPKLNHPSLDKLNIAEAIADSIFGSQAKEKACTFEPSKPCDHCSMCNSRGF